MATIIQGSADSTFGGTIESTGIDDNATSTAITIDSSENVGIGVTPESWSSGYSVLQTGQGGSIWSNTSSTSTRIASNTYYNSGHKYIETGTASQHYIGAGTHIFQVAPSGTADAAISWTDALEITNDGRGLSQFTAKAWVNFNGSGTVAIRDSHNVSSITDNGTGDYEVNMTNALSNTDYCVNMYNNGHASSTSSFSFNNNYTGGLWATSTSTFKIASYSSALIDSTLVTATVFGD